ncbi:hypothetical protein MSG28_012436 [Choristoneura fumiferana]|uniref:Uncharacterized protein n=1 Tax=Choristoneura fumiferana TaxID=7141 RepID=A0ACC0KD73_CHOFU|nr:hypothetical protein MSG28_012436 [Choristoneura fumiferana]
MAVALSPDQEAVVGPCVRLARIATTILLANPVVKQQCLHCRVSAWRVRAVTERPDARVRSPDGVLVVPEIDTVSIWGPPTLSSSLREGVDTTHIYM